MTVQLTKSETRKLAVAADCDPRTIVKVAAGDPVKGMAAERAFDALRAAGHNVPPLKRWRP